MTYMLQAKSEVVDGSQCMIGLTRDQRGAARQVGAACDVGSVEVGEVDPEPPPISLYLPLVIQ
jgi:hypothetical protein